MANLKEAFDYAGKNPNSDFAKNLEALAGSGSLDQEAKKYGIDLTAFKPKVEQPSQMSRLGTDLLNRAKTVGKQVKQVGQAEGVAETAAQVAQTPLRVVGQAAGAVGDVIGAGVNAATGGGLDKLGEYIASTETGKQLGASLLKLQQEQPELAGTLGDLFNIATIGVGGSAAKPVAKAIGTGLKEGAETVGKVASETASNIIDSPLVQGTVDTVRGAKEIISRVPARVATNMADRQAKELAIKSLSSQKAQNAVRDGVDIADVQELTAIPRTPQANKLIQTVKDFAGGNKKIQPEEVVGEETVKRFKEVVKQKKEIGSKLGEASKTIGILTKPELQGGVLTRIQSVPGLEGVTLTPKGKLNFKGTTLEANIPSAVSDRQAIQNAYEQAVKWGDGEKAHMYRQTLFEDLGGKKKGGVQLTGTQEKAFEAIRAGLSDVIETKSPSYKTLSNEYRKIIEPIKELQKRIKTLDPEAGDLSDANLGAGILTRRITSLASSNADIRNLLKNLDSVGTTKGSSFENAMQLQDLYNILNKYYDIAPKTGYQNLTKQAGSDSLIGSIKSIGKDIVGTSNSVRQKALEELLDELGVVLK